MKLTSRPHLLAKLREEEFISTLKYALMARTGTALALHRRI